MKYIILSFKRNILPAFFIIIAIFLVVFSRSNLTAAKNGLELWASTVVPSLFPFFIITNLLSQTKVVTIIGKFLNKIMKPIFNVPGIGGFAFVMGLISGYPVGAKIVSDFRKEKLITQDEGERLLAFTNNSGPLFILSSVGIGLFGDTKIGILLLLTHILSCITVGIILGKFHKNYNNESIKNAHFVDQKKNISIKDLGEALSTSINNSISTILLIGGFIVIFSVILSILDNTNILYLFSSLLKPVLEILRLDTDFAKPLLSGILELTNGVKQVSSIHIKAISQNIILCAFLLGFGGFSVFLQVLSIASKTDLSMKRYLIGKFIQGIFASIYTFLALRFIPFINLDIVETSSNLSTNIYVQSDPISTFFYNFGFITICFTFVFLIFRLFNFFYQKIN